MSTRFGLYIYPWDLLDASTDSHLERLMSAGLSRLHIAASYHAGKFLRPHGRHGKVYFPEDGTVYFRPSTSSGRLKPQPASMVPVHGHGSWWQHQVGETAAWTVANHNSRLGLSHPECCVVNAFGDVYPYSLCPSHPEVKAYGEQLCRDTSQLEISAIQLESPGFLPFVHGYHHEFQLVAPNPIREYLLGLCFCSHCVEKSSMARSMDVLRLQTQIQRWIDDTWDDSLPAPTNPQHAWQTLLEKSADLHRYLQWRCDLVNDLVKRYREIIPENIRLEVIPTIQSSLSMIVLEGSDLGRMATVVDRLELPLYQPRTELILTELDSVLAAGISAEKISVILRPGYPDLQHKGELFDRIKSISQRGIKNINFYNYGHLPGARLLDLGEAIQSAGCA